MPAGIRTQLDQNYASKVKEQFNALMEDLNKKGDINLKANTSQIQSSLKDTVRSVDEALQRFSKLGDVSVPKIFRDENGNMQGFILNLERVKGLIEQIKFDTVGSVEIGRGSTLPIEFGISNVTDLNKTKELNEKIAEVKVKKQEQEQKYQKEALQLYEEDEKKKEELANQEYNKKIELEKQYQELFEKNAIIREQNEEKTISEESQRVAKLGQFKNNFSTDLFSKQDEDIKKYIKSLYGANTEVIRYQKTLNGANDEVIKATVSRMNKNKQIELENIVLDKNTSGVYKNSEALKIHNMETDTLVSRLKNAVQAFLSFTVVMGGFYAAINQVRSAINFTTDIDTKLTDIAMITGESKNNLKEYASAWNDLAIKMKVTTSQIIDSNEQFMRAGKSIEDSNKLTETNIKLSRVSDEDAGKMAEDLVKLSNAYNLSAEEVDKYANKVAYLDSATAASSKSINAATIYAAETAQSTGMSLDYLIAMVTTVEEGSKKGSEAIGRSFKSILLNIEKIQQSDASAPLSPLEKTLNAQGIALRVNEREWRKSEDVIKDIQKAWGGMDGVTRSTIIQYIAGKNQAEEFTAVMNKASRVQENYNNALNATNNLNDKYKEHLDSVKGNMDKLKAVTEKLYMTLVNPNAINFVVKGFTSLVQILQVVSQQSFATNASMIALGIAIVLIIKNFKAMTLELIASGGEIGAIDILLKTFFGTAVSGTGILATLKGAFSALKASMVALFTTPAGLIFLGLASAVGVAAYAIVNHIQKQKQLQEQTDALVSSTKSLTQAIQENNVEQMKSSTTDFNKQQKDLQDLIDKRKELKNQLDNTDFDNRGQYSKLMSSLNGVNSKIQDQIKVLKDSGFTVDETTGKISNLALEEANLLVKVNDEVDGILKEADARKKQDQSTVDLISRYQELQGVQNRSEAQSKEMSNIAQQLTDKNKDLKISVDEHGNAIITNNGLLGRQKDALLLDIQTVDADTRAKVDNAVNSMKFEYNNTTYTIAQVKARIQAYSAEVNSLQALNAAKNGTGGVEYVDTKTQQMLSFWFDIQHSIDSIYSKIGGTSAPSIPSVSSGGGGYIPSGGSSSSASSATSSAQKAEEIRNQMKTDVKDVETAITDIIKKEFDKRKQAIDDDYNARKDAVQKAKDLYNKQNNEDDYNKKLKTEQEKLNGIKSSIASSRDTSEAGKLRLQILQQQEKDQQDVIDNMVLDRTRTLNNDMFDLEQKRLDDEKQARQKSLEEQYSDENISKMVNQAMITGQISGIGSVLNAYLDFQNKYNQGLTASGKLMEDEFISKWQQVQKLINGTSGINIGVSFGSLPKYDIGTPLLLTDQIAKVHKEEAIIPANLNPFRGGDYFNNFMNLFTPKIPAISSIKNRVSPIINFNQPLVAVSGGISSEIDLNKFVDMARHAVTRDIMQSLNNQGIYEH